MFTDLTKALPVDSGILAAIVLVLSLSPAESSDLDASNCIGRNGNVSCVEIWRQGAVNPNIRPLPPAGSEQESAAMRQRLERWQARCRPVIRQDAYGVQRYRYAAPGCDFGRLN
jgi:hypothetical protein